MAPSSQAAASIHAPWRPMAPGWRDSGACGYAFSLARPWFLGQGFRSAPVRKLPGLRVALSRAPPIAVRCNNLLFYSGLRALSLSPSGHNDRLRRYSRVCTTLMIFEAHGRLSAGFREWCGGFLGDFPGRIRIIFMLAVIMACAGALPQAALGGGWPKAGGVPARARPVPQAQAGLAKAAWQVL